jgi:anti-sigma regulatory factor (Ser/Thr protein kinase)
MTIKDLIIKEISKRGYITAKQLMDKTGFSRVYVNRILRQLIDEGKIALIGNTRRARYILLNEKNLKEEKAKILSTTRKLYPEMEKIEEHSVLEEIKKKTGIFYKISKNIEDIVDYAFTEMLNNALEHSSSEEIYIFMKRNKQEIDFNIADKGIGIFNSIRSKFDLTTDGAIGELLKGKITTAAEAHSGEGIFFTSKAADNFTIHSENKKIVFNNIIEDRFIRSVSNLKGTSVTFSISENSERLLSDIFNVYTDEEFEFNKTLVTVKLYKFSDKLLSRSQARRIVTGLERFKTITLDFKNVDVIGQGFADEIFRVWKSNYPDKGINVINANDDVRFMIEHAKRTLGI